MNVNTGTVSTCDGTRACDGRQRRNADALVSTTAHRSAGGRGCIRSRTRVDRVMRVQCVYGGATLARRTDSQAFALDACGAQTMHASYLGDESGVRARRLAYDLDDFWLLEGSERARQRGRRRRNADKRLVAKHVFKDGLTTSARRRRVVLERQPRSGPPAVEGACRLVDCLGSGRLRGEAHARGAIRGMHLDDRDGAASSVVPAAHPTQGRTDQYRSARR